MARRWRFVLVASALLALLYSVLAGPDPLTMYAIWAIAYWRAWRLRLWRGRWLVAVTTACLLLETLAWYSNYQERNPTPALFHPQLLPDLLMSVGVYSAWALVWGFVRAHYRLTMPFVFLVHGAYGVFIEQLGAVFFAGLAALPAGLFLWAYVFIAYGATMALALYIARPDAPPNRPSGLRVAVFIFAALFVATFLTAGLWGLLLEALDIIPPPRFIGDYPLF